MNRNPHVAVVGATGAVGVEMIKTLEKRSFPAGKLTLLASARSAGRKLKFRGQEIEISQGVQPVIDFLAPHCAFFTWGENHGNPDCRLPAVQERHSDGPHISRRARHRPRLLP